MWCQTMFIKSKKCINMVNIKAVSGISVYSFLEKGGSVWVPVHKEHPEGIANSPYSIWD